MANSKGVELKFNDDFFDKTNYPLVGHYWIHVDADTGTFYVKNSKGEIYFTEMKRYELVSQERDASMIQAPNGLYCSICQEPQYTTPSGSLCASGHGGVEGVRRR